MSRTTTSTMDVTETLIAARCTVRRYQAGGGDIEFAGVHLLTGPLGEDMGSREGRVVRGKFVDLAAVTFPVVINGNTVQVAGQTILDALESVYDYLRAQEGLA